MRRSSVSEIVGMPSLAALSVLPLPGLAPVMRAVVVLVTEPGFLMLVILLPNQFSPTSPTKIT